MNQYLQMLRETLRRPAPESDADRRLDRVRLRRIGPLLRPHLRRLTVAALLMIPATLFSLPQPYLARYLVDDVLIARDWETLRWLAPLFLSLVAASALAGWIQSVYSFQVQQQVLAALQSNLFAHILKLPKAYFDSKQTGYLMSRVASDTRDIQRVLSRFATSSGPAAVRMLGSAGLIFFLNWRMALAALVAVPLLSVLARLLVRKLRRTARETFEKNATVYEELEQTLSGVALVKLFAAEDRQSRQLNEKLEESVEANVRHNVLQAFTASVFSLAFGAGVVAVTAAGAYEIFQGRMTVGGFTAFGAYLAMFYGSSNHFAYLLLALQTALAALSRVAEILDLMPEDSGGGPRRRAERLRGGAAFEHVWFSYDGKKNALEDITWSCAPGEATALAGHSGAGKTTLVSLIVQLYKPTSGRILLDGWDVREWDLAFVRERVGFVSQDVFLMDASVEENIRFGRPEASREDVARAAGLSGACEFIERLPEGYQTRLGERGVKLSAGERQRISLARTLLKDPDLLILDEPASSLDAVTEARIRDALQNNFRGRTTFIIAHRLSSLLWADRILVLDRGRLIGQGRHEELLQTCPLYQELWARQTS